MNKSEFLDLLKYYLNQLPRPIVDDIVSEISQHYEAGVQRGKSEEEISKELGSPKTMADEYLANEGYLHSSYIKEKVQSSYEKCGNTNSNSSLDCKENQNFPPKKESSIFTRLLAIFGGIVLFFLFGFPAIVTVIALLFALIATIIALFFAGGAIIFSGIVVFVSMFTNPSILGVHLPNMSVSLHPVTSLLMSTTLIILGLIVVVLLVMFSKFLYENLKKLLIYIKWKFTKKNGGVR